MRSAIVAVLAFSFAVPALGQLADITQREALAGLRAGRDAYVTV